MDAPMGEPANKDAPITLEKQQPAAPAISAGQDTQDQQQQVVSRKLLVILHGKRIEDDQVRDAIKQIQEEGHEVMRVAIKAAAARWPSAVFRFAKCWTSCGFMQFSCMAPTVEPARLIMRLLGLHAACCWLPSCWCDVQVVVRVTWDSGDVDQFVKEAVELWDSQR